MPEVLGGLTGRIVAGLALVAGLFAVLTGSASATPGTVQTQQVRPEQVTDAQRHARPVSPDAAAAARGIQPGAALSIRAPRPHRAPVVGVARGPAVGSAVSRTPPSQVGEAVKYIRLPDGTVVRVR